MITTISNPLIRFENVQKSYDGESLVIKNLNLDMQKGEFLTMLGPSGSGKTTCLMMLAGFEPATHGEIYLADRAINSVPPHKRGIGMVFQNYALFPHMTIAENLSFPLEVRKIGKSEREEKVKKTLDMVQLGDFADRRPGQLSGGQQQRIAVARALVFDPEVVLMDEPLGALDKNLREQMQYEIKHIHERLGITVLYITHDQNEALTMSDRVAVFNAGVIQQLAAPDILYEQPENAFVADFIGDNNCLIGVLNSENNSSCNVTLSDGSTIIANNINTSGKGDKTRLSIRPERIIINPKAGSVANIFQAKAVELIYHGDHIRTRMEVCGNNNFIVKIPNASHHADIKTGDTVRIGWHSKDCRALDF